jgi:integrase
MRSSHQVTPASASGATRSLPAVPGEVVPPMTTSNGSSPRAANLMWFVLRSVLADLVRRGRLARNVAALVDRPSGHAEGMATWTAGQVETFLAAVAGGEMEPAWLLALHGMRRGEVAGLRWQDVDLTAGTLTVRQARVSLSPASLRSRHPRVSAAPVPCR